MFRKLTLVPLVAFMLLFAGAASRPHSDPGPAPNNGSGLPISNSDMW